MLANNECDGWVSGKVITFSLVEFLAVASKIKQRKKKLVQLMPGVGDQINVPSSFSTSCIIHVLKNSSVFFFLRIQVKRSTQADPIATNYPNT